MNLKILIRSMLVIIYHWGKISIFMNGYFFYTRSYLSFIYTLLKNGDTYAHLHLLLYRMKDNCYYSTTTPLHSANNEHLDINYIINKCVIVF